VVPKPALSHDLEIKYLQEQGEGKVRAPLTSKNFWILRLDIDRVDSQATFILHLEKKSYNTKGGHKKVTREFKLLPSRLQLK